LPTPLFNLRKSASFSANTFPPLKANIVLIVRFLFSDQAVITVASAMPSEKSPQTKTPNILANTLFKFNYFIVVPILTYTQFCDGF